MGDDEEINVQEVAANVFDGGMAVARGYLLLILILVIIGAVIVGAQSVLEVIALGLEQLQGVVSWVQGLI